MKILIADDHELFLKGLEFILSDFADNMSFVSARNYGDIRDILSRERDFDLILTDLAMPGGNWLEEIGHIHQAVPETPIIILSAVFDKGIVQKTIESGVSGYIPKTASNAVMLSAIHLVLSGGMYIPPELLQDEDTDKMPALKEAEIHLPEEADGKPTLTPRQSDVLKLIAKGESNKQIAYELGLTEGTVKLHVTAILKLLNVCQIATNI